MDDWVGDLTCDREGDLVDDLVGGRADVLVDDQAGVLADSRAGSSGLAERRWIRLNMLVSSRWAQIPCWGWPGYC